MSVRNGEKLVTEALAGIRNQAFSDFEFIVVDDASTDRTPELHAQAASLDPRIRVLTNGENLILVQSLSRALAVARCRYIARQDADDISAASPRTPGQLAGAESWNGRSLRSLPLH